MESDFPEDGAIALNKNGHDIFVRSSHQYYFGGVNAVEIHENGSLFTGADPRRGCHGEVA